MGTTWQVQVHAPGAATRSLRSEIEATLALVIRQMSHWEPLSDLSRFNAAMPGTPVVLPELLFDVLVRARQISAWTRGAFDATSGALVRHWGFGPDRARQRADFAAPDDDTVQRLQACGSWHQLVLDESARTALQPGGMELDLSAIAKGFAVDLVSMRLQGAGFPSHLVEIGGELRGAGLKSDAQPWWVALEPPASDAPIEDTVIALCDLAVATSGDYRRHVELDGQRWAHTIDPRSGHPVRHALTSVTVIDESCWRADAISTALMVMGADEGLAFADHHGIAARLLERQPDSWREHRSRAWRDMLS